MKPQWSFSSTEKNKNKTKNLPINTGIKTSNLCRTEKGNIKYIKKKQTLNWNYEKHKMSDFYHVLNMRSDFLFLITSFCLALFYCKGLMPPHCWNRSWKAVSTMWREFHFLLKVVFFFKLVQIDQILGCWCLTGLFLSKTSYYAFLECILHIVSACIEWYKVRSL